MLELDRPLLKPALKTIMNILWQNIYLTHNKFFQISANSFKFLQILSNSFKLVQIPVKFHAQNKLIYLNCFKTTSYKAKLNIYFSGLHLKIESTSGDIKVKRV